MVVLKILLLLISASVLSADPFVHSPWGTVRGIQNVTDHYTTYHAFLGIPYAVPPVGDRRFTRPVAHPGFNNTFNATSNGKMCTQTFKPYGLHLVNGDEDCLTLNIYTPASHGTFSSFPVMVWIHGGAFISGGADTYDASPIAARGNVIVVTIQYRLGPFGFLSTGDDSAKGNFGLWDQHLAIQWVKKNIRSFGGDDNRITIIGESAGSASVAFQALYPGSKGLFQRTIMQSGSATSSWAYKRDPLKDTMTLAQKLNCLPSGKSDHASVVRCLKRVSAKALAAASWPMSSDPMTAVFDRGFIPTIDGEFIKDEPLVLLNDQSYLKQAGLHNLDCIVSVNSNELGGFLGELKNVDNALNTSLSTLLYDRSYYKQHMVTGALKLYFGASTPAMVTAVAAENIPTSNHGNKLQYEVLSETAADPQIVVPTIAFARTHAKLVQTTHTRRKTYMYLFDQAPSFLSQMFKGMLHGEDVYYTFGMTDELIKKLSVFSPAHADPTKDERELSNIVIDFLTGFARIGNPSPAVALKLRGNWPQFTMSGEKYLHLSMRMSIASHPFSSRMTLWTKTLPMLLKNWNQQHASTQIPAIIG